MKKTGWKKRIVKACEAAGTYQSYYDHVIETLAEIMETRDDALKQYKDEGSVPIVEHTNKGGNTNTVKNPLLVMVMDCNAQALAYWRDLGLTPAGMKRLGEKNPIQKEEKASLASALADLGI